MSLPWKKWSSEHGPHGPVSPIAQKLSFAPSLWIRSGATPCAFQSPYASSSHGRVPSPANTVAARRSFGRPSQLGLVTNSHPQAIASALK